jgi:hypothetical protein
MPVAQFAMRVHYAVASIGLLLSLATAVMVCRLKPSR